MKIYNTIQYFYYVLLYYCFRLAFLIGIFKPPITPKTFLEENKEYVTPLIQIFQKTFDNTDILWNESIQLILYDKSQYTQFMTESNNLLEQNWRAKILFENTPRGNIIMFYDPYKMGFSFYCDQKVVSYDILNAIASKYVRLFRCRHFFLDESIVPKEHKSPLISTYFEEKKSSAPIKTNLYRRRVEMGPPSGMSLQNVGHNRPSTNSNLPIEFFEDLKTPKLEQETIKNKFIYLGKIANFQMTQPMPKPRKVLAKFVSPILESLGGQKMSFKDYKEWQNKQTSLSTTPS